MKKVANKVKCFLWSLIFVSIPSVAFAGPDGLNVVDPTNMANKLKTSVTNLTTAIGGAAMLLGVTVVGLELVIAHKSPDKRTSAMSSLLYVGIGCFIIGAAALLGGFFWKLGNGM